VGGRAAHFAFFTVVSGLLVAALLAIANWAAARRPVTLDLTKERIFTLADDTRATLAKLPRDVRALAFYRQDEPAHAAASDLLARYARESPRFRYEVVDPYRAPELVALHGITETGPRIVLLAGGGEGAGSGAAAKEQKVKDATEEALTNALVQLSRGEARRVYLLAGHGEPALDDREGRGYAAAARALADEGLEVRPLSLLETGEVPADAAVVLVAGARKALLEPEVKALRAFLDRGGRLGAFLEAQVDAGFGPLLAEWGIDAADDVVVDPSPVSRLFGGSPVTPMASPNPDHPVGAKMPNVAVAFPTTRSLALREDAAHLPEVAVQSAETAWAETDLANLYGERGVKPDARERRGPLPLLLTVERPGAEGKPGARLAVAGDGEFFDDRYQQVLGNLDLFLNVVAWLADEPDRITLRPKGREGSRLFLSEAQVAWVRFATLDVLPVALLGLGLAVWLVRRAR
jgi:ABC-type uncharacterized transport system involved in gliding motility auxiliary subunit